MHVVGLNGTDLLLLPKCITNVNALIYLRFIEWEAIRRLHFDTDGKCMADAFS